jgi:XXXCH domain-containing protein
MGSWKLETEVEPDGLPRFLRALADELESGALESGVSGAGAGALAGLPRPSRSDDVAGLRKLVLVATALGDGGDGFTLRLKAKRRHEVRVPTGKPPAARPVPAAGRNARAADNAARLREKYRQLKKALQADYKALRMAAVAGLMPGQDALESFLALSESMAEAPQPVHGAAGRGPEAGELARANAAFLENARALRRAVAAQDASALLEVLARLERRKSACHAQFR